MKKVTKVDKRKTDNKSFVGFSWGRFCFYNLLPGIDPLKKLVSAVSILVGFTVGILTGGCDEGHRDTVAGLGLDRHLRLPLLCLTRCRDDKTSLFIAKVRDVVSEEPAPAVIR